MLTAKELHHFTIVIDLLFSPKIIIDQIMIASNHADISVASLLV